MKDQSPDGLNNAHQLADKLEKSPATIYRWVKAGILPPPILIGNKRYWRCQTIDRWLDRKEAEGAS